jgi:hypothetical protein
MALLPIKNNDLLVQQEHSKSCRVAQKSMLFKLLETECIIGSGAVI